METHDSPQQENTYFLGDSNAEMVHLIEQDLNFTKAIGGLLPEQSAPPHEGNILDIACGPGGWALEMALAYPSIQVTGIDISPGMIDYANAQAHASGLDNVKFQVGTITDPLPFPDDTFDLINMRHLEMVIPRTTWPALLQEMVRVTRSGGIVRIVDSEWGVSNSLAFERFMDWILIAGQRAGISHTINGHNLGITPWLSRYLHNAGCVNVQERPAAMNISAGSQEHHRAYYRDYTTACQLAKPFMLATQVTTEQEFNDMYQRLSLEMLEDSFHGIIYTLTAWGQKP